MLTLEMDSKNRNLGMRFHTCKVCGAEGEFQSYLVREMMQGTKDEFEYFVCGKCNCLQISEVPEDLGRYYGSDYYSFGLREQPEYQYQGPVINMEKILDVGCGSGVWLFEKAMSGYGNLYGCDPFLEHDLRYGDRVNIRKCSIHEIGGDGSFDMVRMSDSFEHMADPAEALKSVARLLKPYGMLMMSIPIYPNVAFDMFETHWYQLDAPRHIFLHSKESLDYLGKESHMKVVKTEYNSNNSQIIKSFFYQHGVPFREQTSELTWKYFSDDDIARFNALAEDVNKKHYGDHVQVVWMRND